MEDEFPKKRNIRPTEKSNLPIVTLLVLVLLVLAMLYIGYEYISDSSSSSEELTSVVVDSTLEENAAETISDEPAPADDPIEETKPEPVKETPAAPKPEAKPTVSAASIGGEQITHTVRSGETFSSIASRYNLKTETLQGLNSSVPNVKAGVTKLKVQVKAVHTVGPGDVLRVVAGKYGISKEALMKANGKTRDFSERGEKLIIPFPDRK
ncbi:LysM peptidoglycan-binding domain-containing protein [Dyadobacter fermentans]|uniref:Peptidoglycan-binding LysM n=1 Tax=Dyadobacter fermentans (strain ATCC 700827 / DSM 18053 / CIP 107007 / KCTC 52180 / NS114) TaxID=471854 RepID=C6VY50_DYAFD|nr:LysM peptidoglycan-binding domain-containing protein [Dyadobacter fermentans]ACT96951.1 Peptidoglycan-binding LysM [Dyadobacter fermentans DSM 18053]